MNKEGFLLLKTANYEIIDIEKILEFDVNDIDKISNNIITDSIYPKLYIETIEKEDFLIAEEMMEIMLNAPGVGLAANQIGILKKIITINIKKNSTTSFIIFSLSFTT